MYRCIELARRGAGLVAPNPLVGAVLVKNDRIIGEGWHQRYGEAHAEVHALAANTPDGDPDKTLYVSLEPCAHYGKTPPCADLIVHHRIARVVIGGRDPFDKVNGKGIEKLRAAGIRVTEAVLENECRELNARFFTFHEKKRPYIILKWAETADGFIAAKAGTGRLLISNAYSNRLVHSWRREEAAILAGTNTILLDNPELTNRLTPGPSPVRLVLDRNLRLPDFLRVFDGSQPTIVLNEKREGRTTAVDYHKIRTDIPLAAAIANACHHLQLQSVLVEGGARLLESFIETDLWDEIRIIRNTQLKTGEGLAAPLLPPAALKKEIQLGTDLLQWYSRPAFLQ